MTFELRSPISKKESAILEISGILLFLTVWQGVSMYFASNAIIPSPISVALSLPELYYNDLLLKNIIFSLKLNLFAYAEAIFICIPLGFIIALYSKVGATVNKFIDAIRYTPLTAVTGIFIAWLGIYTNMKIQFLAFGIFVYLLPIVIQRVKEVEEVFVQTAYTLGATKWQTITKVFLPSALSKLSKDLFVITAISWTYIITAELINNEGGVGQMIFKSQRQGRLDKVFAILLIIMAIGYIQDKIFSWIDRKSFKFKYALENIKK